MINITPKYKYLECLAIIKNPNNYSKEAVIKAKEVVNSKTKTELTQVTEEERELIKLKYPKTY